MDESKPLVSICASCQHEFPMVDKAVRAAAGKIRFSHGYCKRHAAEFYKGLGLPDDVLQTKIAELPPGCPDLKTRLDLLRAYSYGVFTQQQLASLKEQLESKKLVRRLQSLANIRS